MTLERVRAQAGAVETLQRALANQRSAHAYLFEGPSGVGKELAAIGVACALLCTERPHVGCGHCNTCTRVLEGKHPDVRVFRPRDEGNRNLPVEVVREELLPFAKFAPFEAKAACVIFPEADISFPVQHAEAANALLKTLEEPRPAVTFILLAERPDRLLTTIRSRCQSVRFGPLPRELLAEILERQGAPEPAREAALGLSFGRADRALRLAEDGRAEALLELALRVDDASRKPRPGLVLDLAAELAGHDERDLLMDSLSLFYRDIALHALLGDDAQLAFAHKRDVIAARAQELGPSRAATRVRQIEDSCAALDRNANPETTLDALLFSLA